MGGRQWVGANAPERGVVSWVMRFRLALLATLLAACSHPVARDTTIEATFPADARATPLPRDFRVVTFNLHGDDGAIVARAFLTDPALRAADLMSSRRSTATTAAAPRATSPVRSAIRRLRARVPGLRRHRRRRDRLARANRLGAGDRAPLLQRPRQRRAPQRRARRDHPRRRQARHRLRRPPHEPAHRGAAPPPDAARARARRRSSRRPRSSPATSTPARSRGSATCSRSRPARRTIASRS